MLKPRIRPNKPEKPKPKDIYLKIEDFKAALKEFYSTNNYNIDLTNIIKERYFEYYDHTTWKAINA